MHKHIILFLAANPFGTDRLALDEEARAIQLELERSGCNNEFELMTRWAVQPLDLLRELRKLKPTIVHFSGHGQRDAEQRGPGSRPEIAGLAATAEHARRGLTFQGANGQPQLVSPAALRQVFGAAGSSVRGVVLSACHSEVQAKAIVEYVDFAVGMGGSISDHAARSFAIGFYGALAGGESIDAAYHHGRAAIEVSGLREGEIPRLSMREGAQAIPLTFEAPISRTVATDTTSSELRDIYFGRDRSRLHWGTISIGGMCLSGALASVAWHMPTKGVLGLAGAGVIVIALAFAFDRIPRRDSASVLKFLVVCVVVLLLGLAYAYRSFSARSAAHHQLAGSLPAPDSSKPYPVTISGVTERASTGSEGSRFKSHANRFAAATEDSTGQALSPRSLDGSITLNGSGSTFQKAYQEIAIEGYQKANPNIRINYHGGGNGKGYNDLADRTVDFAGADAPYNQADLAENQRGEILYFPILLGAITVAFDIPGITKLQLSPETIAKIFQRDIKRWDAAPIAADNPGVKLPAFDIVVARRADGAYTTENFTRYLVEAAARTWRLKSGSVVEWPADTQGASGNAGVAQIVKSIEGAIGYIDLSDAKASGLTFASIKNRAGRFIEPTAETASAAANGIAVTDKLLFSALDSEGDAAYPITYQSWVIVYAKQTDEAKGAAIESYLKYLLRDGQRFLKELDFAPLPAGLQTRAIQQLDRIQVP